MSKLVIAIDGPAGAGKSTVSKRLAQELGLSYLDTGAMYRCLALKAQRLGISSDDGEAIAAMGHESTIEFGTGDPQSVFLDGEDVTAAIRTLEIGQLASTISAHTPVRRVLVERQQELVAQGGVILEGRDATTVIAPNADLKIYLTASLEERSRRRHEELVGKGATSEFCQVRQEVEQRDHRDITREDSPLTVAPDAKIVETGNLNLDEVVERIKSLVPPGSA